MQTHSRRRKAFGLAALSLGASGAVFGQAEGAPSTAKEPRPASHFRLNANVVESSHIKNGSLVLKDFKSKQVFSYKAGQRLASRATALSARIDRLPRLEDVYTKAQADAAFLSKVGAGGLLSKAEADQTFLTQAAAAPFLTEAEADALFLTPAEADARYIQIDGRVSGSGLVSGTALVPQGSAGAKILDVPGVGELRGISDTNTSFRLSTSSATPIAVNASEGNAGVTSAAAPYTVQVAPGVVITLQIVAPGGQIVSLTLSAQSDGSPRRMTAQGLVTTP